MQKLTMFLLFCERCCAYWLVFNLHLCMFDWGFPLRTHITCDISDIIVPRLIICVFVFVLVSMAHCLFPATVVTQDFFEEFILEFYLAGN